MSYADWTVRLGAALAAQRPDVRVGDLDPDALREAFGRGLPPDALASQAVLPLRAAPSSNAPTGTPLGGSASAPVPTAATATRARWDRATCPACGRPFRKPFPRTQAAVGMATALVLTPVSPSLAPLGFLAGLAFAAIPARLQCPSCGASSSHGYL